MTEIGMALTNPLEGERVPSKLKKLREDFNKHAKNFQGLLQFRSVFIAVMACLKGM